jgi:hypothetical protein
MHQRNMNAATVYGGCTLAGTIIGYIIAKDQFWVGSVIGIAIGFFISNIIRNQGRPKD